MFAHSTAGGGSSEVEMTDQGGDQFDLQLQLVGADRVVPSLHFGASRKPLTALGFSPGIINRVFNNSILCSSRLIMFREIQLVMERYLHVNRARAKLMVPCFPIY